MKKLIVLVFIMVLGIEGLYAQDKIAEWKVVTVVESIVPMGLGRSRMIENLTEVDTEQFRTTRTDGKTSGQKSVRRKEVKVDEFDETKLLNFYSAVGINFQNVASNDAMISNRIMELSAEGWELKFVTSGVESDSGKDDGNGIFVTRMFFMRK